MRWLPCGLALLAGLVPGCSEERPMKVAAGTETTPATTPMTAPAASAPAAPAPAHAVQAEAAPAATVSGPFAGGPSAGGARESKFPAGEGPRFRGSVALDPQFAALDGRHTLWIIVRSAAGGGAPIAVQRVDSARFPVDYDIGAEHTTTQSDDSHAILKGELKVTARLSLSGNPIKAPGDIEAEPVLMQGDDPPAALTLSVRLGP
jgi:hypothetical protein